MSANKTFGKVFLLFISLAVAFLSCSKSNSSGNNGGGGNTQKQAYTVDASYAPTTGAFGETACLQKDGEVLVVGYGWFNRFQSDAVTVDNSFTAPSELITASLSQQIRGLAVQDDGKILVFGSFVLSGGRKAIVRLNANGSLDNSFNNPVLDINYQRQSISINQVQLLANGKMIIAGGLSYKTSTGFGFGIARLNGDQTIDESFVSPISAGDDYGVTWMQPFPDGSILLIGYGAIKLVDGFYYNVVKISADGTYDKTYILKDNYVGRVCVCAGYASTAAMQDDEVLIAGGFTGLGTTSHNGIARLNADGSDDKTFQSPSIGLEEATSVLVTPDNNIFVGRTTSINFSETTSYLTYLSSNGVADTTFHLNYTSGGVTCMLKLNPTTVLVVGNFTQNNKQYALLRLKKL